VLISNSANQTSNRSDVAMKATVAVAVAGLCAGVVHATTIAPRTTSAHGLSSEANARNSTQTTALGDISMTIGATYELNDELTLTISGTNSPTFGTTDSGNFSCNTGGNVWVNLTNLNTTTTRVFRFAPADSTSVPTGAVCTASNLFVLDSSVGSTVGNTVTLRATGKKISAAGAAYDTADSAAVVATVFDEYTVGVSTAFNGSVDARKSNKIYTDGAADSVIFTITNADLLNDLGTAASTNALTVTLAGDFSFLVNSGETGGAAAGGANSVASVGANTTIATIGSGSSVTGLRLSVANTELPADGNATTFGVTIAGTDASTSNAITAQSFAGDATYSLAFVRGSAESPAALNAGEWTSTGATIFVPYMPISSSIVPSLFWINNSSASGNVFMTVRGESGTCSTTQTVAVTQGMTSLATGFASLIATCQAASSIGAVDKVFITLTGTTPIGTSEVYSAFTVGGSSRVTVVNSSSGYKGNPPTSAANTAGVGNADNNQR